MHTFMHLKFVLVCECMKNQFWSDNLEKMATHTNEPARKACENAQISWEKPTLEIRRAEHRAHMLHGKCSDTWPGRQEVSRHQTPKWVPKPSTARAPTGWATSKTFHTLGILGDIPRQTAECQKIPNRSMELEANSNVKTIPTYSNILIFESSTVDVF